MTKSGGYASNQLLRRLLLEPSLALPQGRIYMRNFGERLPARGGAWGDGANAGLAAVNLNNSRVNTNTNIGFRVARYTTLQQRFGVICRERVFCIGVTIVSG